MKYHYRVDPKNQLFIKSAVDDKPQPVRGRFAVDENNRLSYRLDEGIPWRKQRGLPSKIIFKGNWQLNKNHELELVLDKTSKQFQKDILTIKGNIISVDRDIIAFETKAYDRDGLLHVQLLKLSVTWFADERNRLSFTIKGLAQSKLSLEGNWQINKNQQITYAFEKTDLKTKTRISNTLTFLGFWQINSANKLTYILKHSAQSRFDFRAQVESPTIYPQKGLIKYRLGLGLREQKKVKIIALYGTWKFSRSLGLVFQLDYGRGRIEDIVFAAEVKFSAKDEIQLLLKNRAGQPLGITVVFTRRFLQKLDAEAFLRLKAVGEEKRLEAGVRIPF